MAFGPGPARLPGVRLFVWRLGDDATGVLADNVGWMAWNLLLAVIPAVLAVVLFRRERPRTVGWWIGVGAFVLFLPNAPYLLTDLIHVRGDVAQAQLDRTVVFAVLPTYVAFVIAGFGCYVIALREVARALLRAGRGAWVPASEVLLHAACAFGVLLGRIPRLNSWYVLSRPRHTLREVYSMVTWPPAVIALPLLFVAIWAGHWTLRAGLRAVAPQVDRVRAAGWHRA